MHIILRDPAEQYLARKQLLVSYLLAVFGLKMHVDLIPAVVAVSDDRVSQVRELRPDLVCSTRNELQFEVGYALSVRSNFFESL